MTNPSTHLLWITSRGAGITAMLLASATVGYGLVMGGRMVKGGTADRRVIHEILSLSVMVAVVVHALSLLGDGFLKASLVDVTLPFVSGYKTLATTIGIVAGWGLICLGLSYYLRARIGQQRWKQIHRFTALAWLLALVHSFAEGTDAGQAWFIALLLLTALPGLVLLAWRLMQSSDGGAAPAAAAPSGGTSPRLPA